MRACVLAATLALAACATAPPISEQQSPLAQQIRADNERLDRELAAAGVFAAGIGETADLGGGLTIRPLEVIEDSRCPANVACVWAGRLRLRAEVSGEVRELTLDETLSTPHDAALFAVARPGAWADWPEREVARPAYRFGFRRG
jgi:hypothetical protein